MKLNDKLHLLTYLLLVTLTLLVVPNFLDPYNLPKFLVLVIGGGLICASIFLKLNLSVIKDKKNIFIFTSFFIIPLYVSIIFADQSLYKSLIGSTSRHNGILTYTFFIAIFIFFSIYGTAKNIYKLINIFSFLGLILSCYGLWQRFEGSKISPAVAAVSVKLTLGNIDFAAAFLGLTGVATFFLVLERKKPLWKYFLCFVSLYFHYTLLFDSPARQGRVIFVVGISLMFVFRLIISRISFVRVVGMLSGVSIVILIFTALGSLFQKGPLSGIFLQDKSSLMDRYYPVIGALKMIKDRPFFGFGIESFGDWYPRYNSIEGFKQLMASGGSPIDNPHNVFLNLAATTGISTLFGYVALLSFILISGLRAIRVQSNKFLCGALLIIWLVFQSQSLISIDQIGLNCWAWAFAGCLVNLARLEKTSSTNGESKVSGNSMFKMFNKSTSKLILISTLIFQIPIFYVSSVVWNHYELGNSIDLVLDSKTSEQLNVNSNKLLEVSLKNRDPYLRANIVRIFARFGQIDSATSLAIDSTKKFKNDFETWNTLAILYEATGRRALAIIPRNRSIELNPLDSTLKEIQKQNLVSN